MPLGRIPTLAILDTILLESLPSSHTEDGDVRTQHGAVYWNVYFAGELFLVHINAG